MDYTPEQIADSIIRREVTKHFLGSVDDCKIYAVLKPWEKTNVLKTATSVSDLGSFERAFVDSGNYSIFISAGSGLGINDLKPVINSSTIRKTIFIEQ